jgi:hypothetical protein
MNRMIERESWLYASWGWLQVFSIRMISHDNGPYLLAEANPGTTVERQEHEGVREQTLLALVDETIRVELTCVRAPKLLVCVHHQEPVWDTSKIDSA